MLNGAASVLAVGMFYCIHGPTFYYYWARNISINNLLFTRAIINILYARDNKNTKRLYNFKIKYKDEGRMILSLKFRLLMGRSLYSLFMRPLNTIIFFQLISTDTSE